MDSSESCQGICFEKVSVIWDRIFRRVVIMLNHATLMLILRALEARLYFLRIWGIGMGVNRSVCSFRPPRQRAFPQLVGVHNEVLEAVSETLFK